MTRRPPTTVFSSLSIVRRKKGRSWPGLGNFLKLLHSPCFNSTRERPPSPRPLSYLAVPATAALQVYPPPSLQQPSPPRVRWRGNRPLAVHNLTVLGRSGFNFTGFVTDFQRSQLSSSAGRGEGGESKTPCPPRRSRESRRNTGH